MEFDKLVALAPHVEAVHKLLPCIDGRPSIESWVPNEYIKLSWETILHGGKTTVNTKFCLNKDGVFTHAEVTVDGSFVYRAATPKEVDERDGKRK